MRDFFNCQECVDLLTEYLEGNLEEDVHTRLDEHLATCAPCINFVRTFKRASDLIVQLREQTVDVPAEVQLRVKSFLKTEIEALQKSKE